VALLLLPLSGCQEAASVPAVQAAESRLASAGPARVIVGDGADLGLDQARVVVRGVWGEGAGQFGKDDEATRPGPLALAVDNRGTVHVLDQENRRVQRFTRGGTALAPLTGITETTRDLALVGGAVWTLAYLPEDGPGHAVHRLGPAGPEYTARVADRLELLTGLFVTGAAASPDLWVEQNQDTQVRVVHEGRAVVPAKQGQRKLGRPNRGVTGQRLTARLTGSHGARVMTVDPERGVEPLFEVVTPIPLVAINELFSDRQGAIYVGLFMATEGPAPEFKWEQVRKVVVAFKPGVGHAAKVVEMAPLFATTVFRPVVVGQDGALYQLHTTEQEVLVRRWEPVFGQEVRP